MEKEKEPTLNDIFEVVTFIKDNAVFKKEFSELKQQITKVQSEMVTKEYLDEKLDDTEAEIGGRITRRAEHENKFKHGLVSAMKRNSLLGVKDLKQLEQAI